MIPVGAVKPLLIFAGIAVIGIALGFLHSHVDRAGYRRGVSEVTADYAKRDAVATKAANDRIRVLELDAREKEAKHGQEVNAITANLRKGNADELSKKDAVIAALHNGTVKLRVNLAGPAPSCRSEAGAATDAGTGIDGAGSTGFLLESDAAFLVTEANRADNVARKVNALQMLVLEQIRVCNQ